MDRYISVLLLKYFKKKTRTVVNRVPFTRDSRYQKYNDLNEHEQLYFGFYPPGLRLSQIFIASVDGGAPLSAWMVVGWDESLLSTVTTGHSPKGTAT